MKEKDEPNWYNKALYDIPTTPLNHHHNGSVVPKDGGIDSFDHNGATFKHDNIVVVGGHIGNIERVNLEEAVCALGLSFSYDDCMRDPYDFRMYSGYRSKLDGIRHATEGEKKKYDVSAGIACDIAERADAMYKDKRAGFNF